MNETPKAKFGAKLRFAIVRGGARGLVEAYLLGNRHEVHFYKSAPNLGGHVRTLGQNVLIKNTPSTQLTSSGNDEVHNIEMKRAHFHARNNSQIA